MIGSDNSGKGTSRCDEESFQWEGELVESRVATGCADDTKGSNSKTTETAYDTALERCAGKDVRIARD